jgi:hypothetical protein
VSLPTYLKFLGWVFIAVLVLGLLNLSAGESIDLAITMTACTLIFTGPFWALGRFIVAVLAVAVDAKDGGR